MTKDKQTEIVIIGAGGAGCSAAIEASAYTKEIVLLTKNDFSDSKTFNAQGGIQAAILPEDSIDNHLEDTLRAGNYKNNPALARILTSRAPQTIKWLESLGIQFDRDDQQKYKLKTAAGISCPRVLSCGDTTGNKIVRPLEKTVKSLGIEVKEKALVKSIKKNSKTNRFQVVVNVAGKEELIIAKSVIIATGGLLPKEKRAGLDLNDHDYAPDGVELATSIGAEVKNADLIQYHPTGVVIPRALRRYRIPEVVRGCGAKLTDKNGNEFVDSLATRNKLTAEIVRICDAGLGVVTEDGYKGVWLTIPDVEKNHGKGYIKDNFPSMYEKFSKCNYNINEKPVLVYPIVHYSLGGICINENSETTISGLFAAGETTYGVHGEDRLMGNSLLDIFVFGRIAGTSAAKYVSAI